jgi:radical SAM superfamily enzyme YgiQ (UPF0313 family)
MKKKILLTTIGPKGLADPGIQLALYYLRMYFLKYSRKREMADIEILSFSSREKIETVIDRVKKTKPHIIGFSCYVWNIIGILKTAKTIKNAMPEVKIVFGGPEVSPRARMLIKNHDFIDAIVIGEGERVFKELLESWLNNKTDISDVDGIVYRKNDIVLLTKESEQIQNLDEIPSPYIEKAIDEKTIKNYYPYIPTETMRGCPYSCHYCYYHKDFKKLNYFSLERVERELKYILEREPRGVYLMDPTFNTNKKRSKEILRIIIKHNKKSTLHVELKAELLDEEMVDLLHKAGTDYIEIGIQSTNEKTLKLINRHFNADKFRENVLLLNKKDLPYEIQLIDGLPADNYETLKNSVDWLLTLRPRTIEIMRFMLLPGTYLRTNARRFGITYKPKAPYHSIKSDTFSSEDLEKTEKLRRAISDLYGSGVLRESLYPLTERLGISFTLIFDEWNKWLKKENREAIFASNNVKYDDRIKREMRGVLIVCLKLAPAFVKYVSQKYGKPHVAGEIANTVEKDAERLLKEHEVTKMGEQLK